MSSSLVVTAAISIRGNRWRNSNTWRQRRIVNGEHGGWHDLDYGNLTNAIRDIIAAMAVDCTLAVHSGVEGMI